jgi:histidyl-tRNA synthetase
VLFDPAIVRGFDYYTGLVFEIYDTNPENRRAIFGGGRYDRLLGQFGKEEIPAAGFGMGDVTLEHFLEGHGLKSSRTRSQRAFLTLMNPGLLGETLKLASELRSRGLTVETSLEATKKFGKQLELAEKKGFRYVLILGEDELHSETVIIKDLQTGTQHAVIRHKVADELKNR